MDSWRNISNFVTWNSHSSFHCSHTLLRDTSCKKRPFVSVGITRLAVIFKKASNIHLHWEKRFMLVASRRIEITFNMGSSRQRGQGFGALAHVIRRTAIPVLFTDVILAAKRVFADVLDYAVQETEEVASDRTSFKQSCKQFPEQTLRKELGSGGRKQKQE